jgi:hypothetical protein
LEHLCQVISIAILSTFADAVGYVKNRPNNVYYIAFVGEHKARREKNDRTFSEKEKGQLVSYMQDLCKFQPKRHEVTGQRK